MSLQLNETHDVNLRSWAGDSLEYPIQNLPIAIFRIGAEPFRGGIAIGDSVLDLAALARFAMFDGIVQKCLLACSKPELNEYMGMGVIA